MRLDPKYQELVDAALVVSANAYAPYSRFQVGSAVRARSGAVYTACNVENASYPISTCAERNAIAKGVAAEGAGFRIESIAVVATQEGKRVPCTPCGACRQAIAEFAADAQVIYQLDAGTFAKDTIASLLPGTFRLPG